MNCDDFIDEFIKNAIKNKYLWKTESTLLWEEISKQSTIEYLQTHYIKLKEMLIEFEKYLIIKRS